MELITTYPAAVNSKATVTMGVLDQATTIVEVLDATVLPEAPNLLVLGTDQTAETVLMTARENNTLTIQRAVQGIAKSWPAGTQIARNFTGKDWDDMRSNVEAIVTKILGLTASDVGARPDTWMPTASDVGAMRMIYSNSMGGFLTLLDVANSLEHGGSFTIDNSLSVVTAEDYPVTNEEMSFIVFGSKDNIRRIIIGFLYNDLTFNIYKRDIFQGKWQTEWRNMNQRFLPLDGSVPMSGNLGIEKSGYPVLYIKDPTIGRRLRLGVESDGSIMIAADHGNNTNRSFLVLKTEKTTSNELLRLSVVKEGTATNYRIFGEHNKPSGSYTGNGSATSRTITTDGIGNAILIWGNSSLCLACPLGCFYFAASSSYKDYMQTDVKFENGVLKLTSASTYANASGVTYNYQVL